MGGRCMRWRDFYADNGEKRALSAQVDRAAGPLNDELLAVLALNPFRGLATASPSLASSWITVLRGYFGTSISTGQRTTATRSSKNLRFSQLEFIHQSTHGLQCCTQLSTTGFLDFGFKNVAFLQEFFVIGHDVCNKGLKGSHYIIVSLRLAP